MPTAQRWQWIFLWILSAKRRWWSLEIKHSRFTSLSEPLKLSGTLTENEFSPNFISNPEGGRGGGNWSLSFHIRLNGEFLLNFPVNGFVNGSRNELPGTRVFADYSRTKCLTKTANVPPWSSMKPRRSSPRSFTEF